MNKPKPQYTVLIKWKLTILSTLLILWSDPAAAQTKAVEYVKTVYGGETRGVKTAKVYYYNAQFGDINTSIAAGKFYQMIEMGQDRMNRPLYNIYIRPTNDGLDTNIDHRYRYESENQHFQMEYAYPKWPNRIPYDLNRKWFTDAGLLKTEERIATDKHGEVTSYKKVIYEYDERNRLSQKRDSAAQRYSWNDYETVSKYEQIITTYHYDTLGVKCYIEENKVDNSGFRQPVSRSFITDSIGKTNRKYYYKLTESYYIASEYTEFDKRKNPIRHEYFRISHDGDKYYADSALVKSMYSQYNSKNQLTRYENKLENMV